MLDGMKVAARTSSSVLAAQGLELAAIGERAESLRWLQRAFDERSRWMVVMHLDPQLAPLRGDAVFEAIARKVGL